MMIYGYARVSTKAQAADGNSLMAQREKLMAAGADRIFCDAYTGKTMDRPEFDRLLQQLRPGDTLMVTKIDRFARSISQASELIDGLMRDGIKVHVLNIGVLDDGPTGRLMRNMLLAFAEFERDMIMERTREGKEIARKQPDYHEGRPRKFTTRQIDHALELLNTHSYTQVADLTGISKSTLIRRKKERDAMIDERQDKPL